jgi:hypothetical protein
MTIELASSCAKRINIEAAETAMMPKITAIFGGIMGEEDLLLIGLFVA